MGENVRENEIGKENGFAKNLITSSEKIMKLNLFLPLFVLISAFGF